VSAGFLAPGERGEAQEMSRTSPRTYVKVVQSTLFLLLQAFVLAVPLIVIFMGIFFLIIPIFFL
jgi:hypothetical protein